MKFGKLLNKFNPDLRKIVRRIEIIRRKLIKRKCSKFYLNKCYIYINIFISLYDKCLELRPLCNNFFFFTKYTTQTGWIMRTYQFI